MSADISLTSLDIAELVRNQHENVMRTIRTLASAGAIQPPLIGETGETSPLWQRKEISHYVFAGMEGKRDSLVVAAQLLPDSTGTLFDRWQELEGKVKEPDGAGRVMARDFILREHKVADISIRDYFAAAALQGMLAGAPDSIWNDAERAAEAAYEYADAMMAERDKRKQNEKETTS